MSAQHLHLDSPVGRLTLVANDDALTHILWETGGVRCDDLGAPSDGAFLRGVATQLKDYFAGNIAAFDVPIQPKGTELQTEVWEMLGRIPFGDVWTYTQMAQAVGRPSSVRAVAQAIGKNPIPIIVPCHRVVGKDGKLTGFSGGLDNKTCLLNIEGAI